MQVNSTEDVRLFMDALERDTESRVRRMITILEENGHTLRMPDSKALSKGLFELRILNNPQIRILYFFHENNATLVHAFFKKSKRIPRKEIEYGRKIMKMLLNK